MASLRNVQRAIAATLVAAGIASLVACTSHHSAAPSATTSTTLIVRPSDSPRPTPTVAATTAAATAAVLEAYRGYWTAKVAAFRDPTADPSPDLARFATDTAFSDVATSLFTFRRNGIQVEGDPVLDPQVTAVDPSAHTATIVDCVDGSSWQPIYTATGKSAAQPGLASRLLTTSTATYLVDHWAIRTSVVDHAQTC